MQRDLQQISGSRGVTHFLILFFCVRGLPAFGIAAETAKQLELLEKLKRLRKKASAFPPAGGGRMVNQRISLNLPCTGNRGAERFCVVIDTYGRNTLLNLININTFISFQTFITLAP